MIEITTSAECFIYINTCYKMFISVLLQLCLYSQLSVIVYVLVSLFCSNIDKIIIIQFL